jgi:hypothetical protein
MQYDKVNLHPGTERAGQGCDRQARSRFDYPEGRLSIRYKGVELAYRTFDKLRQVDQGAIAGNKRLAKGFFATLLRLDSREALPKIVV